jgi:PAS domain S-box-containing protein
MALVGTDFKLAGVNNSFCSTLGYSRDELLGQSFSSITHPDDMESDEQLAESLRGDVPCYQVEKRYLTRDGNVMWGNQTASVVRGEDGAPLYGIVMVEDITERRRAEEALRRSESRYRQIVVNLHEGLWIVDEDAYTTFVNEKMAAMLGHSAEEMVGRHAFSFMDELAVETCKRELTRRRQGIQGDFEIELETKSGDRICVIMQVSPILDGEGEYHGALASGRRRRSRRRTTNWSVASRTGPATCAWRWRRWTG